MTTSRMLDFDLFMEEKETVKHQVKVFGEIYEVDSSIPAIVPIMMSRAYSETMTEGDATIMIMRAADAMFGEEAINEMCKKGMTTNDLADLVKRTFDLINGKDVDGEDAETLSDEDGMTVLNENKAKK